MYFDLDAGEDITKRYTFIVPELRDNSYILKVEVEGRDENNNIQNDAQYVNLVLKNDEPLYISHKNLVTTAATSNVEVTFAGSSYNNKNQAEKQNKKKANPSLQILYILITILLFILYLTYAIRKVNKS